MFEDHKVLLDNLKESENDNKNLVFYEFLSTSHEKEKGETFIDKYNQNTSSKDIVDVLYIIKINKEIVEKNNSLLYFIEDLSEYPWEKEVLISSSTIFCLELIENPVLLEENYYKVTMNFVSNGFDKYDYFRYINSNEIYLGQKNIGVEGVRKLLQKI